MNLIKFGKLINLDEVSKVANTISFSNTFLFCDRWANVRNWFIKADLPALVYPTIAIVNKWLSLRCKR